MVVGDGALMAALTRTRGARMRDIVATIQRHQDEAIRAPARGVTEITGGPGTGKTVVALHRAAYLLYSDRRRFEAGGILVVGPSARLHGLHRAGAAVARRGDRDAPLARRRRGRRHAPRASTRPRPRRSRARCGSAGCWPAPPVTPSRTRPTQLRAFVAGRAIRLEAGVLDRVRSQVLRSHQRNHAADAALQALAEAAWASPPGG